LDDSVATGLILEKTNNLFVERRWRPAEANEALDTGSPDNKMSFGREIDADEKIIREQGYDPVLLWLWSGEAQPWKKTLHASIAQMELGQPLFVGLAVDDIPTPPQILPGCAHDKADRASAMP